MLTGYAAGGDLGAGAIYSSQGASSSSIMAIQDASGTWFGLVVHGQTNVGYFGCKGDSVTNDTANFQSALNSGAKEVLVPSGTFVIRASLTIPASVELRFIGGSLLAAGTLTGNLLTQGNHLVLSAKSKVTDVSILAPTGTFALSGGAYAAVLVNSVNDCLVQGGFIDLTGSGIDQAVAVYTGDYNRVANVTAEVSGFRYTSNGGRFNSLNNCISRNSTSNAFSGAGDNASRASYGNVVSNCVAFKPARMGFEEAGDPSTGKHIYGTKFIGCRVEGGASASFFAVSLSGEQAEFTHGFILNWPQAEAIELIANQGNMESFNHILWTNGNPNSVAGVQINPSTNLVNSVNITSTIGSIITGAQSAILVHSTESEIISVAHGMVDFKVNGYVADDVSQYTVHGMNVAKLNSPNAATRTALLVANQSPVIGNLIRYLAGATGGSNLEFAIRPLGSDIPMIGNSISGSITSGGQVVQGINSNGATGTRNQFAFNSLSGTVKANYQNMTSLFARFNNIQSRTITGSTFATLTDNSATPSVLNGYVFLASNSSSTSITDFTNGIDGQEIVIVVTNGNTTFDFTSANLSGNVGVAYAAVSGDILTGTYRASNTTWYCTIGQGG